MPQRDVTQRESSGARGIAAAIPRQAPRQLSSQHRTHGHPPARALALRSKQKRCSACQTGGDREAGAPSCRRSQRSAVAAVPVWEADHTHSQERTQAGDADLLRIRKFLFIVRGSLVSSIWDTRYRTPYCTCYPVY
eukprot:COSAG02_NODE_3360_length_6871_cov_3.468104_6_plen_136_part_00